MKEIRFGDILSKVYLSLSFWFAAQIQKGLMDMGKSLKGKELGKGISQRKDGLYQARFTNRFGKRQVIYDKTYNVVALETGMRVGELAGLQWEDIDFHNKVVHVKHSMTYFSNAEGKYVFELHPAKTHKGLRDIPLTQKAVTALKQQYFNKQFVFNNGKQPLDGFENLVYPTLFQTYFCNKMFRGRSSLENCIGIAWPYTASAYNRFVYACYNRLFI